MPPPPFLPAILSISSINTIPDCSTCFIASSTTLSISTRCPASSWARSLRASFTLTFLFFEFLGIIEPIISFKLTPISSMPVFEKISTMGIAALSETLRSTNLPSNFPLCNITRNFSRVEDFSTGLVTISICLFAASSSSSSLVGPDFGKRRSRTLSSAICLAFPLTASCSLDFNLFTVSSTISLIIDSTSRPTYPISVNFVASTLEKGESVKLASRLAISVFPTPVGPIRIIFFGAISSLRSSGTCFRLQRFLNATATERFASFCPIIYLSNSITVSDGLRLLIIFYSNYFLLWRIIRHGKFHYDSHSVIITIIN